MRRAWVGPVALLLACTPGGERPPADPIASAPDGGLLFFAVGEQGTVLRSTDAVSWEAIPTPTTGRLLGVHGDFSRTEFYVVGEPGLLRSRDDGRTWTLDPAVAVPLRGVFGDGVGTVIATGERGEVLRVNWKL